VNFISDELKKRRHCDPENYFRQKIRDCKETGKTNQLVTGPPFCEGAWLKLVPCGQCIEELEEDDDYNIDYDRPTPDDSRQIFKYLNEAFFIKKSKLLSKLKILVKGGNFGQKSKFWSNIQNFGQTSIFWSRIEIFVINKIVSKIETLVKKQNFVQNRNFGQKT